MRRPRSVEAFKDRISLTQGPRYSVRLLLGPTLSPWAQVTAAPALAEQAQSVVMLQRSPSYIKSAPLRTWALKKNHTTTCVVCVTEGLDLDGLLGILIELRSIYPTP